jgi:hypothetical protein
MTREGEPLVRDSLGELALSDDPLRQVAIVIPVGPGDRVWPPLRECLSAHAAASERHWVFAEHDPQPATIRVGVCDAGCLGERVHQAPAGRAAQQNHGADATHRPWLWFLHADSRPNSDVFAELRRFVVRDEAALGWYRLGFGGSDTPTLRRRMRLNAAGANWRSRRWRLPFGDQGLVLPRATFHDLGRFDTSLAYGEDFALVWRARRVGIPLRELPATLDTSARKYAEHGWLRITARHLRATAALAWHEAWREAQR